MLAETTQTDICIQLVIIIDASLTNINRLIRRLVEKANGSFLWASLIMRDLADYWTVGIILQHGQAKKQSTG